MPQKTNAFGKIVIIVLFCTAVVSLLTLCQFYKYMDWQTVTIPVGGTFKVPKEWVVTQEEHIIYITDKS